jgi:asparagine synthase (glutamine-hydrolysing)
MCGIAGFLKTDPSRNCSGTIARMAEIIRHRGPDDSGFYEDPFIALGHRRLSIIDLSGGHQPIANEDGSLWITYNGEIFNHADLRVELERAGHRFRTRCDTETVVHAFETHGPDCLRLFRGMFAFALWDRNSRTLFCARDRLGKKPLYYYWDGRLFAFASEVKALLEHPGISPALNESLLPEYLSFGYTSGDQTLFAGIRKLPPGYYLTLRHEGGRYVLDTRCYWDVPCHEALEDRDDASWVRECRTRLEDAVRTRLMSDVPLGVFLSGGVDSSAIAALMTRVVSGPIQTFSVGYAEEDFSELNYARRVALHLGTRHHEVLLSRQRFFDALPRLVWHEDEPITWPSSVSLYAVSLLASRHVKVVLTGEGADELFAGYTRYRLHLWNSKWMRPYRLLPAPLRRGVRSAIATSSLLSANFRRKLGHTFLGRDASLESLYLDNFYAALSPSEQQALFRLPYDGSALGCENFLHYWRHRQHPSLLARMLYADQKTYLVELLMKQDQMSMATSIESRVPLLDHHLVEFAARLPDRMKLRGSTGKYILKKAAEDLLPRDILYRTKMGFPTPLRPWLLGSQAASIYAALLDPNGFLAAYVDRSALENLLNRHQQGVEDASDRIWRLLNLEIWGGIFITETIRPHAEDAAALLPTSSSAS